MYSFLRLITLVLFMVMGASSFSNAEGLSDLFSKTMLENTTQRLKALKRTTPYTVSINFAMFRLNNPKTMTIPKSMNAFKTKKLLFSSRKKIREKFDDIIDESFEKAQNQIGGLRNSNKHIVLLFTIGIYYDYFDKRYEKYALCEVDAALGADVPFEISKQIKQFMPFKSFNVESQNFAENDAFLDEFIKYVEQVILPESEKNYILFANKKYYNNDILYVAKSPMPIQLRAFNPNNIPFGNETEWDNATSGADKSTASFVKDEESEDLSGAVVKASSNSSSVTIRIVVISIEYAQSLDNSIGFDDNDPATCKKYPSFNTSPIAGMPWQLIPSDNEFVPVAVTVVPREALKKINLAFYCSDIKYFNMKSPTLTKSDDELQLLISSTGPNKETDIIPKINGVSFPSAALKVAAYIGTSRHVAVVMIEEGGDDIQLEPVGAKNLDPMTAIVSSGVDGFLDTKYLLDGDDKIISDDPKIPPYIVAGRNGKCETLVNSKGDRIKANFDLGKFEKALNNIYNPYLVKWVVDREPIILSVNYDINRDNKFNTIGMNDLEPTRVNQALVQEKFQGERDIDWILCLIGKTDAKTLSSDNYPLAPYIFVENIRKLKTIDGEGEFLQKIYEIGAKELGHRILHLEYIPANKGYADYDNLMYDKSEDVILRKFQWDIIHGAQPSN